MSIYKRLLAMLIVVALVAGWYVTIFGIGSKVGNISKYMKLGLDLQGGVYVVLEADTKLTGDELSKLMNQTQAVIEKRVNELGLTNPIVTIENENRIRVELPGAEDAESAIDLIGQTAQLQFITADGAVIMDGSSVKDAGTAINQQGAGYVVTLNFDSTGSTAFEQATQSIVNGEITLDDQLSGIMNADCIAIILDNQVLSAPKVSSVISGGNCQIEGNYTQKDAAELAALIRGGSLPVDLTEVETNIIGPSLGMESLNQSIIAAIIGVALVMLMMLLVYRVMGIAADIALAVYCIIYIWILVAANTVLTLPGIAGMILSVGMAVDANVIIFSRIKEEIKKGKTIRVATMQGYKRALATIIDSQVTTLIAGLALYFFGSGDVRGFALTLMIGIILSIITATIVTNVYLQIFSNSNTFGTKKFFGIRQSKEITDMASTAKEVI